MLQRISLFTCSFLLLTALQAQAREVLVRDFAGGASSLISGWATATYTDLEMAYPDWRRGAGALSETGYEDAAAVNASGPFEPMSTSPQALEADQNSDFSVTLDVGPPSDLGFLNFPPNLARRTSSSLRAHSMFSVAAADSLPVMRLLGHVVEGQSSISFALPRTGPEGVAVPVEFRPHVYHATDGRRPGLNAFGVADFAGTLHAQAVNKVERDMTAIALGSAVQEKDAITEAYSTPEPADSLTRATDDEAVAPVMVAMNADDIFAADVERQGGAAMAIGMNTARMVDWSTDWAFVDVFKKTREWLTRDAAEEGPWSSEEGEFIPVDLNGWPTHVPFIGPVSGAQQIVHTTIHNVDVLGTYTFLFEGAGRLEIFWTGGSWTELQPTGGAGSFEFEITERESKIQLKIHKTGPSDHLRNFAVIMPGFVETYETKPFHPAFLDSLSPFFTNRFMEWGRTNHSPVEIWDERTRPEHYTQSREEGVALEHMVQLGNTLQQDIWICIPARADDDYVTNTARLLRDSLDDQLKIYVEYSNETWNTHFSQTTYVQDQGEALQLDENRSHAGHKFVALRSSQIWRIFEDEFSLDGRIVKVLGSHSAANSVTEMRIDALDDPAINPDGVMPDVLAIAPYFGVSYDTEDLSEGYPTVDELLDIVAPNDIEDIREDVIEQKAMADSRGWRLVCYEGGQHFVGRGDAKNDDTLTEILIAANRDARMYGLYIAYLDMLEEEGVDLMLNYNHVDDYTDSGSWGALERQDQTVVTAHKYRALLHWSGNSTLAENAAAIRDSMDVADQNGDGRVTYAEALIVIPGLSFADFIAMDDENDGGLTMAELLLASVGAPGVQAIVWVDFAYSVSNSQMGTESQPFDTIAEAAAYVVVDGTIKIKGNKDPNFTFETPLINKGLTLMGVGGSIRIGGEG